MTDTIAALRQRAIDDIIDQIDQEEKPIDPARLNTLVHENADYYVPAHFDQLLELAGQGYGNCAANFFLLATVESGLLASEISASDVLQRAVYEFLLEETEKAVSEHMEEEEGDEE